MSEKTFKKMYSKEEIKAIANDSVVTAKTGCRRMWTEEEIKAIAGGGGGGGGGDTTTVKKLLDTTKNSNYLFFGYQGTSVDGLIVYDDTSNVTNMSDMYAYCYNLTTVPLLNTSNVTNMNQMFYKCYNLTAIPLFDTSKVINMASMFKECTNLTTIPALDVSNAENLSQIFNQCTSLKSILMTGMKTGFTISASTKFERTDLVTILNNLATVTDTKTLTMGATNLAKLTDEDKAIATNKGWTLA